MMKFMSRCAVPAALIAWGSFNPPAASALVPSKDAQTDSLGIVIAPPPDVYVLKKGSIVYHGTIAPFDFNENKTNKQKNESTWFGADQETSKAMGYFRWCGQAGSVVNELQTKKKFVNSVASFAFPEWPRLMTVEVLQDINLLFVPYGADGHLRAFKTIGYDPPSKLRNLYGSGSTSGNQAFNGSGLCNLSVSLDNHAKITASGPASSSLTVALGGWRAPWDQNEIAICPAKATNLFFIKKSSAYLGVTGDLDVTPQGELQKLQALWNNVNLQKAIKLQTISETPLSAYNRALSSSDFQNYITEYQTVYKAVCGASSVVKTKDVYVMDEKTKQKGYFDIIFSNKTNAPSGGPALGEDPEMAPKDLTDGEGDVPEDKGDRTGQ